ncbi:MAG: hypothetical protein WD076_09465 [Parvularculaceae bacterium]
MKPLGALAAFALVASCASAPKEMRYPVVVDAGGCALEQITSAGDGESHFQFEGVSRDGGSLFVGWQKDESRGACILDLKTGDRRDIAGLNNSGVFSRDGTRLLVANTIADGTTEILEYDIATGEATPVAPHPRPDFLATYSPDDRWILFNSYRTGRSDLYLYSRDGGDPLRLTYFDGYDAQGAFSPDMKTILFHRNLGQGNYDIYQIDFENADVTPLITGPGEQSYASWSPDGRFIAYASDAGGEPGKTDIFVADRSGALVSRLTNEPGYNAYPSWSPDGRLIYFVSERGGARNVFRVAVDDGGHCRGRAN